MQIILNSPFALHETGGGSNNEDCIFPAKGKATAQDTFFLVCDGIGGQENGEVASRTVCDSFASFSGIADTDAFDETVFRQALDSACRQLNKAGASAGTRKMGTTLTFICFHRRGAFMAHVGDSRIYHIRKQNGHAGILYKSVDHSYVNELVRANIITEEEAATHPKRNVITRALQSGQEQPVKAEIHDTDDVEAGDYFFLCSDGILEQVNDVLLCDIIARDTDDSVKMEAIRTACQGHSRDNFSAYLIPVAGVTDRPVGTPVGIEAAASVLTAIPAPPSGKNTAQNAPKAARKKKTILRYLVLAGLLIAAIEAGFFYADYVHEEKDAALTDQPDEILLESGNSLAARPESSGSKVTGRKDGGGENGGSTTRQRTKEQSNGAEQSITQVNSGVKNKNGERKSVEPGNAGARNRPGGMNKNDGNVPPVQTDAAEQRRDSTVQGDPAARNSADVTNSGENATPNHTDELEQCRQSAEQGNADAQYRLGLMHLQGRGFTEAAKWFQQSAKQGNANAQNELGQCYYYERGVKKDDPEAAKWFRQSAEQGNATAQYFLGWMYDKGWGVSANSETAIYWFRKSAKQGNKEAQKRLRESKISY